MFQILVVEDDKDLNRTVCAFLNASGYQATGCLDANAAYDAMYGTMFDLIVSDIMMPGIDGFEFARTVRSLNENIPIVFMTARDDFASKQRGFRIGVDDYMVKPVRYPELIARVEAVIRRSKQNYRSPVREYKSFTMDTVHRRIFRQDEDVNLTNLEYALLEYMSEYPNKLLLYRELHENVWKSDSLDDFRALGVHVSNLRKKIDPEHRGIIENVRGAGYVFSDV